MAILAPIPISILILVHLYRRHGVWIAILSICSYKLGQKMNLNFCVNMAGFCRQSHIAKHMQCSDKSDNMHSNN